MRSPETADSQIMKLSPVCSCRTISLGKSGKERKRQPSSPLFGSFPDTAAVSPDSQCVSCYQFSLLQKGGIKSRAGKKKIK